MIFLKRNLCTSCTRRTMVGSNDEYGILKPRLPLCFHQELTDSIISVFHPAFTALPCRRNIYSTIRVCVRTMIADGHDIHKKRFLAFCRLAHYAQRFIKQVFITYAPHGTEGRFFLCKIRLVDHLESIATEECLHIIKIAVATIYKE